MDRLHDYLINKIFTVPYLDRMIDREYDRDTFARCVSRYVEEEEDLTYGKAISKIYHYMNSSYRNEYYYKNTIMNQLLIQKHDIYNTVALTELPIAESKADFVMINGRGIVYEIKTDLDNYSRLKGQLADYYKAFKYVYVVIGYQQYNKMKELLNDTKVGIYVLNKNGNMVCRKKAKCNLNELNHETIFRILRKKEYEKILLKHYGELPQVKDFYYYRSCLELAQKINIKTFQQEMLTCLKERSKIEIKDMLEQEIPYELRFYAYFTKDKNNQYQQINDFWNEKVVI